MTRRSCARSVTANSVCSAELRMEKGVARPERFELPTSWFVGREHTYDQARPSAPYLVFQ